MYRCYISHLSFIYIDNSIWNYDMFKDETPPTMLLNMYNKLFQDKSTMASRIVCKVVAKKLHRNHHWAKSWSQPLLQ